MAKTITLAEMLDRLPKPDRSKEIAYYTSLGRFIHRFAAVESYLQLLLATLSGADSATAKAVYSGTRIDAAMSLIKRIFQARGLEIPDHLSEAFSQLNTINGARNDIVHFGAVFEDGMPKIVTNTRSAHIAKNVYAFPISAELIDQMHEDLGTIMLRLIDVESLPKNDQRLHDSVYAEVRQRPWLYKHEQRGGSPQKSRAPDRKRKPQRPPSPA